MLSAGEARQRGRELLTIEASAVRTAAAVIGPLVVGQLAGHEGVGLLVALGALYLCIADKFEVSAALLLLTTLGAMGAVLAGSAVASGALLSVFSMAFWAFSFSLLAIRGDLAAHLGFVLTIVFAVAQGMPLATPSEQLQRALLFGCGGLLATLATLLLRHFTPAPRADPARTEAAVLGPPEVPLVPAPVPSVGWHALRLTLAATVAVGIEKFLRLDHGHWIVLTALVIVKPDYAATSLRARERIVGTIAGGIIAVPLAVLLRNTIGLDLVLAALCVLAYSHLRRSYGMYSAFLTPFVVLLVNASHPGDWRLALTRVEDSLAGGALALTVAFLLRSRETAPLAAAAAVSEP